MNKKIALALCTSLLGVSLAQAAPGAYLQVQAGTGGIDTKKYSATSTPTTSNPYNSISLRNGVAYRAAGGYLWNAGNLDYGVEAGYSGYPQNQYKLTGFSYASATETYKSSYVDLLGVAKYNFSQSDNGFYAIGKAGVARVAQKFSGERTVLGTSVVLKKSQTAYKPEVALGVGYDFNKNVGLDVTYQHIFAGKADPNGSSTNSITKVSSVNTLMAGLTYHFS